MFVGLHSQLLYLCFSGACTYFSFWCACMSREKKKKKFPQDPSSTGKNRASNLPEIEFACTSRGRKKIPSETQVLETRVPLVWTFKKHSKQSTWNKVCLHVQREKKKKIAMKLEFYFRESWVFKTCLWISSFKDSRSSHIYNIFFFWLNLTF